MTKLILLSQDNRDRVAFFGWGMRGGGYGVGKRHPSPKIKQRDQIEFLVVTLQTLSVKESGSKKMAKGID